MKRVLPVALVVLLLSCEPAVRRVVVLTFNDPADVVTISASTTLGSAKKGSEEAGQIEDEREALLAGRDEWSARFSNADPETDRVILQRSHGELQSVEHIASLPPENLQKFFFDTPLTVNFSRGEGWAELTVYPGTSLRATRRQRENVERMMAIYSERAARYFESIRAMYAYLDEKPQRASDMFEAVFRDEKDPPPRVSEDEKSLVDGVRSAIDRMLSDDDATATLDRDFDLVFNPFPADLKVVVTGEITALDGFTRADRMLIVKLPDALEAVGMLEGRWITPDPLAAAFNAPKDMSSAELAASIATQRRRAEPVVTASDVAAALMQKMRPAATYRVRWLTKAAAPSQPQPRRPGSSEGEHTSARSRDVRRMPALPNSTAALRARSY